MKYGKKIIKFIAVAFTVALAAMIALPIASVLTGCSVSAISDDFGNSSRDRFVQIEKGSYWIIVYDSKTKVMYVVSDGYNNHGSFTVLVDQNGNPLLYEEDTK